jgi:hypothetical protein
MGNWYKNVTLWGPPQAEVAAALARHQRQAYVTPTRDGLTVVFDARSDETGDPSELGDLALTLSQELACVALAAAVFDDDALLLALYEHGTQTGEYNSTAASSLGAAALARAFHVSGWTPLIWALLHGPHLPFFVFESFRHRLLLRAFGHPPWAFATGYNYIHHGEPPEGFVEDDLLHVGDRDPS